MAGVDIDLESGNHLRRGSEEGSLCFSEAEEGSCYSQFYSTAYGSYDECDSQCRRVTSSSSDDESEKSESRLESLVAESEFSVEIEDGEMKVKVERDCRICHLSMENFESGVGIELGCSCKDDLAAAHKVCAETWFKIKGNKTCEICNSIARNVVVIGSNETEPNHQRDDANQTIPNSSHTSTDQSQTYLNGHRFVNFLLACMVFAFVISWLFHFNIPS